MMELQSTRTDLDELEFLAYVKDHIARVDEIHATDDDDTAYTFILWLKDVSQKRAICRLIHRSIENEKPDSWETKIYDNDTGIIIVTSILRFDV